MPTITIPQIAVPARLNLGSATISPEAMLQLLDELNDALRVVRDNIDSVQHELYGWIWAEQQS